MRLNQSYEIREYITEGGRSPFRNWLGTLDRATQARVQARVFRFETGNLGDFKQVGGGVYEARLTFGPGYRIYFGIVQGRAVLLLGGGSKATQSGDIRKAQGWWAAFREGGDYGKTK